MHIEFLTEELSAEKFLSNIIPKILGKSVIFNIHPHQGKEDLLLKLPGKLRAYKKWIPSDWKIVVLIDQDKDDCQELKTHLEKIAREAGFITSSAISPGPFSLLNRIAIEELEAWFFGDMEAMKTAYPRLGNLDKKKRYRNPDLIRGGTWEALERELKKAGYHAGGFSKISVSGNISPYMKPEFNRSRSFQVFREGLRELVK
jgi:hypothetical protein